MDDDFKTLQVIDLDIFELEEWLPKVVDVMLRTDSYLHLEIRHRVGEQKEPTHNVVERDEEGRPTVIDFDGDAAKQCPACLSENVEPLAAIGFVFVGDSVEEMSPVRIMHCDDCHAQWVRPGL